MLLSPYRALDLTQKHGMLCAQLLGDLGADVIQVEAPGGAPGRRLGPFFGTVEDPELSLSWAGYSRGKRSIELDVDTDRETFLELVARTDFLIESEPVGSLEARGIGYEQLREVNPALILVSLTPFGPSGPKAHWAHSDLTLVASAGPMALTGDSDRPPLRLSVPQAWCHAAAEGLAGALAALTERYHSGLGQHVEISAQQALTLATQGYILSAAVNDSTVTRTAGGVFVDGIRIRLTYPAADGHVSITHFFGASIGPATRRLMEYVYDEGFCDEATRDKDWLQYALFLQNGEEPIEEFERVKQCIAACTSSKTKAELLQAAVERKLLLAPVSSIEDVARSPQLAAREFFVEPQGDGPLSGLRYPGAFARFSRTPLALRRPPPSIGEHTQEVLSELREVPPRRLGATGATDLPALAGVKVLDFMWALAGPGATRAMADLGATVVRIESSTRLDVCRTIRPFINGNPSTELSAVFHTTNAGKRMLTLDLTKPEARLVVLDLVRWADVVTESFSPKVMEGLGLDYASLKEVNPDLIMLSSCLMGQTGPLDRFTGYGNLAAAITGFFAVTGWPDRAPAGPFAAYTDYIAPRFNLAAVLAALDHRRRTGEGQHIDLAQAEASMHFLTPAILDYSANGNVGACIGNADPHYAPHGVYPTDGKDTFIAIACETDDQWRGLCKALPELAARHPDLASSADRLASRQVLDSTLAEVVRGHDGRVLEVGLQEAGVPAAVVQNSPELIRDPQLLHLGHFVKLPHPEGMETVIESGRIHLSRSPTVADSCAPTFGRDMMHVMQEFLSYDDATIGELLVAGVFD